MPRSPRPLRPWLPVVAFLVVGGLALAADVVPWWILAAYGVMSVLCFTTYAADKRAAVAGRRRVPERTLLTLGLLGGWPGAVAAQQTLRHKTIKQSFRSSFWRTVVVNVAVVTFVAFVLSPRGRSTLDSLLDATGLGAVSL